MLKYDGLHGLAVVDSFHTCRIIPPMHRSRASTSQGRHLKEEEKKKRKKKKKKKKTQEQQQQ